MERNSYADWWHVKMGLIRSERYLMHMIEEVRTITSIDMTGSLEQLERELADVRELIDFTKRTSTVHFE